MTSSERLGRRRQYRSAVYRGVHFDVLISYYHKLHSGLLEFPTECTLEWWEKTDNPPKGLCMQKHTWTLKTSDHPNSPVFSPWRNRQIRCPGRPDKPVDLFDGPKLSVEEKGPNALRKLCILIVVRSGFLCNCPFRVLVVTAKQWLKFEKGKPFPPEFKTPFYTGYCKWP